MAGAKSLRVGVIVCLYPDEKSGDFSVLCVAVSVKKIFRQVNFVFIVLITVMSKTT